MPCKRLIQHSLSHSRTHSLTLHSLTHSLAHSLTCASRCSSSRNAVWTAHCWPRAPLMSGRSVWVHWLLGCVTLSVFLGLGMFAPSRWRNVACTPPSALRSCALHRTYEDSNSHIDSYRRNSHIKIISNMYNDIPISIISWFHMSYAMQTSYSTFRHCVNSCFQNLMRPFAPPASYVSQLLRIRWSVSLCL